MLEFLKPRLRDSLDQLNSFVDNYAPLIFCVILSVTTFQKLELISQTDGGGDLLGADIPKSMMLISGQNPYASNPWASPYPLFLLAVVGGIIKLTSGNLILSPSTIGEISRNVRLTGLVADAVVALLIYSVLRARGFSGLSLLVPAGLFLSLPSISLSPYYWFNSDVLGYPILAVSILALVRRQYLLGSVLLALATVFKIHPILAVPLVMVWLIRRVGLKKSLPTMIATSSILSTGLAAPVVIHGYVNSVLGFNLSSGFGGGTSSFTMMNLLYDVFPSFLKTSFAMKVDNEVWLGATAVLFTAILGIVWARAHSLNPVDVVTLGLLAWLMPLRQIYTHYVVWAVVPFLMRGRLRQTLVIGTLLETANTMSSWSWDLPPDPFPILSTGYGFFATSLVYLSLSATALFFVLRGVRSKQGPKLDVLKPVALHRGYLVPVLPEH